MSRVLEVSLSSDAYLVCSQHVHTTDGEEVMGLLVGCYIPYYGPDPSADNKQSKDNDQVICDISHAVILRRSDKRKDRVEISPEMLIQAQQTAEEISLSTGRETPLHIVGWYHSHPKITVAPSAVDLRTQMGYQQMDDRFVGLIFSVFNKSEISKVHEEVLGGFQALPGTGGGYARRNVPVKIRPARGIAQHNQQSLCSLSNILQQEQMAVLQQSRALYATVSPLQHVYNSAVAVQRIVDICEQVPGPLTNMLHCRTQHIASSVDAMQQYAKYLQELIKKNGLEEKFKDLANMKIKPVNSSEKSQCNQGETASLGAEKSDNKDNREYKEVKKENEKNGDKKLVDVKAEQVVVEENVKNGIVGKQNKTSAVKCDKKIKDDCESLGIPADSKRELKGTIVADEKKDAKVRVVNPTQNVTCVSDSDSDDISVGEEVEKETIEQRKMS